MSDTRSHEQDKSDLLDALSALEHAAGHLSAIDVAGAEASLAECEYRPLTKACIDAATKLRTLIEERFGIATAEHAGEVRGEVHQIHGDGVSPDGTGQGH